MKKVKLYNVIFPVWMLFLVPAVWLISVPANFLIDSLVLFLGMCMLKMADKKVFYKKNILKFYLFGFLADFVGVAFLFLTVAVLDWSTMGDDLYLTIPALMLSAVCIFFFNYVITLRMYDKKTRRFLAVFFAIATAPYTFLIPTAWLY